MSPSYWKHTLWILCTLIIGLTAAPAATLYWNKDTTQGTQWTFGPNWATGSQGGAAATQAPQPTDNVLINQFCTEADPVVFNAGSAQNIKAFTMGHSAGDAGYLTIRKSRLIFDSGSTYIGRGGIGLLRIESAKRIEKYSGGFVLGNDVGSSGTILLDPNAAIFLRGNNAGLTIGKDGEGSLLLANNSKLYLETNFKSVNVGIYSGTGIIDMRGGRILADNATSTQNLKLGYNGGTGSGNAYLQGYGDVKLLNPVNNIGKLMVGGGVIGDGTATDETVSNQTLDIINYSHLITGSNTPGSTFFGYFTSNQGAISLPDMDISSSKTNIFWGDDQTAPGRYTIGNSMANGTNVLLNSAYLRRPSGGSALTLDVSLLDPTRTQKANETGTLLANNTGVDFLNIWQVDVSGGALDLNMFAVRYDETEETNGAGNFDSLDGFYYWDGSAGTWTDLTGDSSIDTANFLANYNGSITIPNGSSGFFALAASGGSLSPFGIAIGGEPFGQYPTFFPLMDQVDIVGARGFPNWNVIEPTNDAWNWTVADNYLDSAEANNINVSGVFAFATNWAAPSQKHFPMSNLPEWEEYVGEVTKRYAGRVKYWEVWNEPNAGSFNAGNNSAADYATLLRLAYAAAKAEDPDAQIGISIANFHVDYIRAVITALGNQGAADSFDFIAVHPYELAGKMNEGDGEMYYLNIVPALRQMLAVHAPSKVNVPIWFTELGAKIGGKIQGETIDEDLAAEILVKVYALGIAQGAERVSWFNIKDAGGSQGFGLLKGNNNPRKTYTAYDAMTDALGTTPKYKGWLTPDSNGWGYGIVFDNAGASAMAAWMPKGESASVSFGTTVEVVDIKTNTSTNASSITLTDEPVLIKGLPASMVATAEANKSQPFPWSSQPVNANLAEIELGEITIERGLELDRAQTVSPNGTGTNGVIVSQPGVDRRLYLSVSPSFMDYNTETFHIRVTCRLKELRNPNDPSPNYSGMNLFYQDNDDNETATPVPKVYNNLSGSWRPIPNNLNTHTFTWTVTDGMMVHTFGYSFYLNFDSSNPFIIDKVEISKVPF
ncbi:MAG: endo-1,4-beta-xylanase [Verrucomicrobiota bacterium]